MKRFLKQIFLIIFPLLIFSFSKISMTRAVLFDEEQSTSVQMSAGSLDFSLVSLAGFAPLPLTPGVSATRSAVIVNSGSLAFDYDIHTIQTGGDNNFCNVLNLEAKLNGLSL